ncbi:MAG: hypothetical protein L0229_20825 [Blastocatellia bacterium]|nr:hypothetical protein [Blastocatellia bacterium]
MKLTQEKLKELMQQQSARSTGRQAECLTEDQFARAVAGEMNREDRLRMANHLIVCADCTEEYRILRSLKSWAEEAERTLASSVDADSRSETLQPPIRIAEKKAARSPRNRFAVLLSSPGTSLALAASLLIVLTSGVWLVLNRQEQNQEITRLNQQVAEQERSLESAEESLEETRRRLEAALAEQEKPGQDPKAYEEEIARLRRMIAELSRPQLDAPIIDLDPAGAIRGGPERTTTKVEVPDTANSLTLILNFSGRKQHSRYLVEVLNDGGRSVWRGEAKRNSQIYSLNLTLSRRLVPAGRYLIKLYGFEDGEKELVADYSVLISYR